MGKDNAFSLDGAIYSIPKEHNHVLSEAEGMVAFKVQLHIHPGKKIRVWHKGQFLCELPYIQAQAKSITFFDGPRLGGIILPAR